jgi:hypothetical protein
MKVTIKELAYNLNVSDSTIWFWTKIRVIEDAKKIGKFIYIDQDKFIKKIIESEKIDNMSDEMLKKLKTIVASQDRF